MRFLINIVTVLLKREINNKTDKSSEYKIEVCMLSDVGCHRSQNEDSILYVKPSEKTILIRKGLLAIVADGMGGHQSGEIASRIAIEVVSKIYYQEKNEPLVSLKQAFVDANKMIFSAAQSQPEFKGMGTTCTALVLRNSQAFFAHVGDSRLYRLRNKQIELLTEDHTMVHEMFKKGLLSPEQAEHHPHKNIIIRAMGTHPDLEISTQGPYAVQPDDYYLLCSDGLYDAVKDNELKLTVMSASPHAACEQLVALAKKRGGYDNISVGIIAIRPALKNIQKTIPTTRFG